MMEASISTCVNGKSKRLSVVSILLNSLRVLQTRTELLSSIRHDPNVAQSSRHWRLGGRIAGIGTIARRSGIG